MQDIEAEDHILGPLTLRQFIYGLVAVFLYYICFLVISKHVVFLLVLFLPPALAASFFAFPFKRDQPTEVWALAKIRFMFKPRKRIWNQSGVNELVTITAPIKVERRLTKELSPDEVQSRLQALALTIDTRGWAVKNMQAAPQVYTPNSNDSDRLISVGSIPKPVADYETTPNDDLFDDTSPKYTHLGEELKHKSQEHRQELISLMSDLNASQQQYVNQENVNTSSEEAIAKELKNRSDELKMSLSNLHTVTAKPPKPKLKQTSAEVSPETKDSPKKIDPEILNLALNSKGLSVQTLAHEASKEVVIKLH